MNRATRHAVLDGPAGALALAIDEPTVVPRGVAVICHPHPQHGGTMDNKVVQTLARALLALGWRVVRFNFRGVGGSAGHYDEGAGELDDTLTVVAAQRDPVLPLALAGFSFGGWIAARAAAHLALDGAPAQRLALVAPASNRPGMPVVPTDTLVIHGEADDVVPLAATLDWARPQALPVWVLPGVGHFFHGQLPLLRRCVEQAWRG